MKVATLGSGSRGNSVLVECCGTRLLIDAGFSGAEIARRLGRLGVEPASVEAVVVTHEHRDHTAGIGVVARRWGWPVYMTPATADACSGLLRGVETVHFYEGERPFRIGQAEVHPFSTCHDATDPIAVTVSCAQCDYRVGIATDLGRPTGPVRRALAQCHFLVLESNHDELMLRESPYPWSVKQRIGGSRGHMSNRVAAELAVELVHPGLGGILLAHLSDECNDPAAALDRARRRLGQGGYRGLLAVASQDEPSPLFDVRSLAEVARDGAQLPLFR